MANILRHGRTPKWGVSLQKDDAFIFDSFNISYDIKDYQQTDENGAVCGYLVYDQTINFDINATVLNETPDTNTNNYYKLKVGSIVIGSQNGLNVDVLATTMQNCNINTINTYILKSLSISESSGGAQTVSMSGTGYSF